MRQGQGSKRSRNRGGNRRGGNRQQSLDSNGPSVRIRGNAQQIHEKYLTLARDASSSGDRVSAENFSQHAEHYHRVLAAEAEQREQRNSQQAAQQADRQKSDGRDSDSSKAENLVKSDASAEQSSSAEVGKSSAQTQEIEKNDFPEQKKKSLKKNR